MKNAVTEQLIELILISAASKSLKKIVLSKSYDKTVLRAVGTLKSIGGNLALQVESLHTDNKATHENIYANEPAAIGRFGALIKQFAQVNLITTVGACELRSSSSGKTTLIGGDKLLRSLKSTNADQVDVGGNNRKKNYILDGSEPFLIKLGVSDKNGRPHDKKLPKLRQINRFLEYVRDMEKHLPSEGVLRICDLCCGKSYLSFAVYHYFAIIKGRTVDMIGVDLKADVMEFCDSAARELSFSGLRFISGDVAAYEPESKPHLVVSLHACDTATDLVLNKASAWRTKVILSTPCCHHEMNHKLSCPTLSFIAEHSMLRQKFCDAATDALRLKKLESEGYSVEAVELVDPDDTPKNILLRAVLNGSENQQAKAEYESIKQFLYGSKL